MTSLFNSDYLQHLCKKYNVYPSKKYGQNFLINSEPIEKMLNEAGLSKDDVVVEVGPGFGVLTFPLAERVKKVYSFEIEKRVENYWQEQVKKHPNIEIIWGNVLKEVKKVTFLNSSTTYKVIANLPYQITSPLIRLFLELEHKPETMILMVQKEVAERICAKPGEMSVLSVAVQYYSNPEYIMTVPRSYFWPEPRVDSAIIKISLNKTKDAEIDVEKFFKIVKAGFVNRRKKLFTNLVSLMGKDFKEELKNIFDELKFDTFIRAQELSIEDWQKLTKKIFIE